MLFVQFSDAAAALANRRDAPQSGITQRVEGEFLDRDLIPGRIPDYHVEPRPFIAMEDAGELQRPVEEAVLQRGLAG